MKILFWIAIATDAALTGLWFLLGLAAAGPSHTHPLAVIGYLLLVPALILAGLVFWFVRASSTAARIFRLLVAASPLLIAASGLALTGASMFANPKAGQESMSFRPASLADLESAVLRNDVYGVRRAAAAAGLRGRQDGAGVLLLSLARVAKSPEQLPVLEALLNAGADPNGGYGAKPLEDAIRRAGGPKTVELLLAAGADPNLRNPIGDPIFFAATDSRVDVEVLRMLIDRGATVNIRSQSGDTALRRAVTARNWKAAQLLLDRGALPQNRSEEREQVQQRLAASTSGATAVSGSRPRSQRR
jgi:hypothetical protein